MFNNDKGKFNYRVALASQECYSRPIDIINKIPDNIFPSYGPEGALERIASANFLNNSIVGNEIEFITSIEEVGFEGNGPFKVSVYFEGLDLGEYENGSGQQLWREEKKYNQRFQIYIKNQKANPGYRVGGKVLNGYRYSASFEEGKNIRNMVKKKIKCRAKITDCSIINLLNNELITIELKVLPFQADAILPKI
jgi:hypothetical protein